MLGTDTHIPSKSVHISLREDPIAIDEGFSLRWFKHSRHHLDRSCLSSAVVSQQSKDLTFIHSKVDPINSFVPIVILFC